MLKTTSTRLTIYGFDQAWASNIHEQKPRSDKRKKKKKIKQTIHHEDEADDLETKKDLKTKIDKTKINSL